MHKSPACQYNRCDTKQGISHNARNGNAWRATLLTWHKQPNRHHQRYFCSCAVCHILCKYALECAVQRLTTADLHRNRYPQNQRNSRDSWCSSHYRASACTWRGPCNSLRVLVAEVQAVSIPDSPRKHSSCSCQLLRRC